MTQKKLAFKEIEMHLKSAAIVIFIRGDQKDPQCKASRMLVECLTKMQIKFKSIDILKDDCMKEWIKFYANWPNYPMVFIDGKFIGSTEIVMQLIENDKFLKLIPTECIKANSLERMMEAMNRSIVVLFMKGTATNPMDGYQKRAVKILT